MGSGLIVSPLWRPKGKGKTLAKALAKEALASEVVEDAEHVEAMARASMDMEVAAATEVVVAAMAAATVAVAAAEATEAVEEVAVPVAMAAKVRAMEAAKEAMVQHQPSAVEVMASKARARAHIERSPLCKVLQDASYMFNASKAHLWLFHKEASNLQYERPERSSGPMWQNVGDFDNARGGKDDRADLHQQ